jgi:hypothetical protein
VSAFDTCPCESCKETVTRIRAQARAQALEEAAQMCEELDGLGGGPIIPYSFTDLASDFRALAAQTPKATP